MNSNFKSRIPHMAQPDLIKSCLANDKENISCQNNIEVKKEVCQNIYTNESSWALASISVYISKKTN